MTALVQFLSTNGDGTGTISAIGNYATTADEFYIEAPTDTQYELHRLIVSVQDSGAFDAADYGNGVALTNGIELRHIDSNATVHVNYTPEPITSNADWGAYCFDVDVKTWGVGDEVLLARWTFTKFGSPMVLTPGEQFSVKVNDDLSGLVAHRFVVEGTSSTYV